jgi:integrase
MRIKTGMSAVFTYARQCDFIRTANPVVGAKAEGHHRKPESYAYTIAEIKTMLARLGDPARAVVAPAAFSGLRTGELRGLRWEDFTGDELIVRRSVWRTHVAEPKTPESAASVPVIPVLKNILEGPHQQHPGNGYIFAGPKRGGPLHLDNLARREIILIIGPLWNGWHAFRRGFATNLFELGIQPKVVEGVLRHSDIGSTAKHYIVLENREAGRAAMEIMGQAWDSMGPKKSRKR